MLLLLSCFPSFGKDQDGHLKCKQFRTGKYYVDDTLAGRTYIVRNDSVQIETGADDDVKAEFRVSWVNECTYVLTFSRILEDPKGNAKDWPKVIIVTVSITSVAADSYMQTSTSNLSMQVFTNRVVRRK